VVAVLPGSRTHEVHANWPIMLASIRELYRRHPDVRFCVAAFREKHADYCRSQMSNDDEPLPLDFYVGKTSEIIEAAQCAMMVSGSVSLELMARDTPAAVIYRVGRVFHAFAKTVMKIDSITLPNLMHDSAIREGDLEGAERPFDEFVSVGQREPGIDFLTRSVDEMLTDPLVLEEKRRALSGLRQRFARPGAGQRAAQQLLSLLEGTGDEASAARPAA
ncbi:MAG: lipid-A-disaccharide synthase, partial [Planctomycetota bacterium]